jgi:hypothetical protein
MVRRLLGHRAPGSLARGSEERKDSQDEREPGPHVASISEGRGLSRLTPTAARRIGLAMAAAPATVAVLVSLGEPHPRRGRRAAPYLLPCEPALARERRR